ncbi:helix-turn-helix domain-containing protein [Sphingobium sp.]|uniref:helix-turn-helix domain-containing protein n=1 Tax=Sphingobium sp. TaxID=1912891 RepID=UPI0026145F1A|nr:helix-turn-helix domain-containing protein [Sphingobium sp.]
MGTLAFGEALAGALGAAHLPGSRKAARHSGRSGAPHPTGAPVLRDSVEEGTVEHLFFAPPAKGETDRLLRAARRLLDAGRQLRREARSDGRLLTPVEMRITTLTAASVRVLEEILTLSRLNRGRVFPSYDHLAAATSLGRATVARALRILEGIGLLVRQRRFKRVPGDGPGPRYAQTSNIYRAFLPEGLARYLPRWLRPAPLPDDVAWREAERRDEMALMRAALDPTDRKAAQDKGMLAKILARIEAALDRQLEEAALHDVIARESQNHPQPLTKSILDKKSTELALPANTSTPDGAA